MWKYKNKQKDIRQNKIKKVVDRLYWTWYCMFVQNNRQKQRAKVLTFRSNFALFVFVYYKNFSARDVFDN